MSAPSVSVLIPSYNCARYLPETIESVLAQDFRDFELVILDDRSTDSSNEVLESYARRDERIRYRLNERNLGLVENWNACLREARGKYVKFLHSDDKLTRPTALEQMLALLEGNPDASLAACGRETSSIASGSRARWISSERSSVGALRKRSRSRSRR